MPHAIIEYSANLASEMQAQDISALVHRTSIESGLFGPENLKTRSYKAEDFHVGTKGSEGSFMHIRIYMLEGRSNEQKKELSEKLVSAVANAIPAIGQLSVDIRDMNRTTYAKYKGA
ncbi:MAG: 5-carboxymethyl-2-hydroxymuconate isomerase [Alphaproteobacteria bacterium]|nr:5-carboxymethyl-2-hydroxymuconate isomerase [Alphaproteobacteria bacterium]